MPKIKTYKEILDQMIEKITSDTPLTNLNPGSVIRTLAEVYAAVASELYVFAGGVLKNAFLSTAKGRFLDLKAKEYGVIRKQAVKTEGRVIFSRLEPKNENIVVPAGSIIATGIDEKGEERKYLTKTRMILQPGEADVSVPVIAEVSGKSYNVGPGSIKRMKTFIKGIDNVINPSGWITTEGTDEEDDESLRNRTFLSWEELARGSTKAAYISWAMSVTGVKHVYVNDILPRGQGTVDIFILSDSGLPSESLIEKAQEKINRNKPICSDALVKAPANIEIPVIAHITPIRGFNTEVMESQIRKRLDLYFSGFSEYSEYSEKTDPELSWLKPLGVGTDVIKNQVIEIIMSVEGVYNIELNSPERDLAVAPFEFAKIGLCSLSFGEPVNV